MRLFEHPEFEQAILAAEQHFAARGLRAAIIEKDYYVTEALRAVANAAPGKTMFKGGTSLSKGWNLIERFSEDVDLFLDPRAFQPALGKKGIDRELKRLRDAVKPGIGLKYRPEDSRASGGAGRSDTFIYEQKFAAAGELAPRVLLESGTASGREPSEEVLIRSYVGQFLEEAGRSLGASDEAGFRMRLLHFRRTFVEKLFAIHAKVEIFKQEGIPVGIYARHYYDLSQLGGTGAVRAMLASDEYGQIKTDYDEISRKHFARDYHPPPGMSFRASEALFPPSALSVELGEAYDRQCRVLCFGRYPEWNAVLGLFEELRHLL